MDENKVMEQVAETTKEIDNFADAAAQAGMNVVKMEPKWKAPKTPTFFRKHSTLMGGVLGSVVTITVLIGGKLVVLPAIKKGGSALKNTIMGAFSEEDFDDDDDDDLFEDAEYREMDIDDDNQQPNENIDDATK